MERYPLEEVLIIKKRKLSEAERVLREKKDFLSKEQEKLVKVQKEYDDYIRSLGMQVPEVIK